MSNWVPATLLAGDEPSPCEPSGEGGASPFVVICDHAGNRLPRSLGTLGLSSEQRESHIAWDIGAGAVARYLAASLGAWAACQRYSRLVIDCNRPLEASDSIVTSSERTVVPGNQELGADAAAARAREIFHPYHARIRDHLDERQRLDQPAVLVAVHSFTPTFLGEGRPWHIGILFGRDERLAQPLMRLLRAEGDLSVGCNEPYAFSELSDHSLVQHGERRGIPHVELEIRQDLIADESGQRAWAARLARLLPLALHSMLPHDR